MQALDPFKVALQGKNLIQASAGTGKTWTISLLYLRLVIEQALEVQNILVVTYTKAATEELRERIRLRLKEALTAYEHPESAAHEYALLVAQNPVSDEILWYLKRALLNFDEAAVFTIHGFCQRALQENAFEVGIPFESELVNSEDDLLLALSDQFWQQHLLQPHALYEEVLQTHKLTPNSLLYDVKHFIGKPYLQPRRPEPMTGEDFMRQREVYADALQTVRAAWQNHEAEVRACLASDALKQTNYKPKQVEQAIEALQSLLAGKTVKDMLKHLEKFTPAKLEKEKKKGKTPPEHTFFRHMEVLYNAYVTVQETLSHALDQLRYELLDYLRTELPERKRQAGLLAFDDLLIQLQDALTARPVLARTLAKQYQVALIDEFQDTDPVQFNVFESIYAETLGEPAQQQLYYVGDPKQAIYSFRGADINTYLKAASGVTNNQQFTLHKNWRSHADLVKAFNHLFQVADDPFRNQKRIDYEQVQAGGRVTDTLVTEPQRSPLRLWDWDALDEKVTSTAVVDEVAQAVANDIAQLLSDGQAGTALIGDKPVTSGDIAILVRSHKQARLMKEALQQNGIASVQKSPLGIFQTPEAIELRAVLSAIAEPAHEGKVRRALVTELMGGNAAGLLALDNDPVLLDRRVEQFHRWHQLWLSGGFMRMFHDWLEMAEVRERLLAFVDGERRLTNLLHLSELIHSETREHWRGMAATLRWLQRKAEEQSAADDVHQLRLESDENLVQIVTIHRSKGLQYPIVYCPFLWNDSDPRPDHWFAWHDDSSGQSYLQAGEEGKAEARAAYIAEGHSENLRLLYVALTRAQYHCTVVLATGAVSSLNYYSALTWVLFGHLDNASKLLSTKSKSKLEPDERQLAMHQQLRALTQQAEGTIQWCVLPRQQDSVSYRPHNEQQVFHTREFTATIPPMDSIGSFSGLTSGKHDERPDYDQTQDQRVELSYSAPVRDVRVFPGGRRAGVCLHKLFEDLDFTQSIASQRESVTERVLQDYGFADYVDAAEVLLQSGLQTQLVDYHPVRLAGLSKEERLDEMEFYFPVEQLNVKALQRVLLQYLPDDWQAIRQAVKCLSFAELRGFMKGYIDLIFRAEGRFYIVDYKSNWLGDKADSYAQPQLAQAMADAHYYLQYLIYCVAVHRYLQQRLPDYEWNRDVGGVLYLFLRGMQSNTPQSGVFFHKPDSAFIEALSALMGEAHD